MVYNQDATCNLWISMKAFAIDDAPRIVYLLSSIIVHAAYIADGIAQFRSWISLYLWHFKIRQCDVSARNLSFEIAIRALTKQSFMNNCKIDNLRIWRVSEKNMSCQSCYGSFDVLVVVKQRRLLDVCRLTMIVILRRAFALAIFTRNSKNAQKIPLNFTGTDR